MKRKEWIYYALAGAVPVIWLALLIAPYIDGGLPLVLAHSDDIFAHPFSIILCKSSLKVVIAFAAAYVIAVVIAVSSMKNYRRGEEMGSAKWGDAKILCKKYEDVDASQNKILTQNVRIGFDGRKHRRNLNTIVCGGLGAGKTRFFVKPNIMQANTSMVVLDPKSETLQATGRLLEAKGYEIKVLDLINMEKSHCYNPFVYLKDENDVQRLVTNLFKATTPKGSTNSDPFWDTSASMLLLALMFYLLYEAPPEEQNFAMVMEMLRAGAVDEEDTNTKSILDRIFDNLADEEPDHIAVKYYRDYRSGSGKTLKSIQITLASRLEKFNLESIAKLSMTDELELEKMGERKTALFAIIPDNDTSFNFLVSMLYTQLFQQLFYVADHKYGGRLPVHVHFLLDEFANVTMPDDFDKILSVMRSREVSVSIILQNMAQLKANFEKQHESILGNCDEFLYLGGNETSTHRMVSELLGKQTIDINSYNRTHGNHGSYGTNWQVHGREILDPAEVRMLDNRYAILFVRGESAVKDLKYDILSHPDIMLTEDGGAEAYVHGKVNDAKAAIRFDFAASDEQTRSEGDDKETDCRENEAQTKYELISEEELMEEIKQKLEAGSEQERAGDVKDEDKAEKMYEW